MSRVDRKLTSRSNASSERAGFIVSLAITLLMAGIALTVAVFTGSQAILLDGMFNAVFAVAAAFTLHVSKLLRQPSNPSFPYGYAYFVPLVNMIKSLLIAGVSLIALWYAIAAMLSGGNDVPFAEAMAFAAFSAVACATAALIIRRIHRQTQNELLRADLTTWSINAAISGCLVLSFAGALMLQSFGFATAARYADSTFVTLLVLLSIGVPYSMGKDALSELLAKAPDAEQRAPIETAIRSALQDLGDFPCLLRLVRVANRWEIFVEVTIPASIESFTVDDCDRVRARVERILDGQGVTGEAHLLFSRRSVRPAT
ncbi:cation transporter [Paraburkholderia sp. HP33-1]|uniref:cation transporter n=1 Tax=Paraburkholderia sp. HP33-1 TaxID=2883243 RepID=UPI001F269A0E|nr:cation transporter [Paraburkholderia sp. HP33-1]